MMETLISSGNSTKIRSNDESGTLLSDHVRRSVDQYFDRINGHSAAGLYAMVIGEVEKPLIETVLKHVSYNQTKASKVLGISRSTLHKKMVQYGLE